MAGAVCENCRAVQTPNDVEESACEECGSESLTAETSSESKPITATDRACFP